jgi:hypothetical protein
MLNQLYCSACKKSIKSGRIYDCEHILCIDCDIDKTQCIVCSNQSNNLTEPNDARDNLHFEWSSNKKHETPSKLFDSKQEHLNNVSTTHRQSDMTKSRYTSLFCQRHDEPLAFYHPQLK